MTISEKITQLIDGRLKSAVAESAGISPSVLSKYINRGSIPPANIALKLAAALDVPLDWLVDDTRGFPPPKADHTAISAESLDHADLMDELAKRYLRTRLRLERDSEQFLDLDLAPIARAHLQFLNSGDPIDPKTRAILDRLKNFDRALTALETDFNVPGWAWTYGQMHGYDMPGEPSDMADSPIFDLRLVPAYRAATMARGMGGVSDKLKEMAGVGHQIPRVYLAEKFPKPGQPEGIDVAGTIGKQSEGRAAAKVNPRNRPGQPSKN